MIAEFPEGYLYWLMVMALGGLAVTFLIGLELLATNNRARDYRDAFMRLLPLSNPARRQILAWMDFVAELLYSMVPVMFVVAFVSMAVFFVFVI